MTDIVKRLRSMVSIRRDSTPLSVALNTAHEAADEIERLDNGWAEANSKILDRDLKIVGLKAESDQLRARLAEAEKDATRSRHEWQRECEDTDLLLQGMGLCPSEYRSECGSLLLARIRHKMGHIGLRLDETLARLAEAEALLRDTLAWIPNKAGAEYMFRRRIDAFLAPDSATHRENERG